MSRKHVHHWKLTDGHGDAVWGRCRCGRRQHFDGGIDDVYLEEGARIRNDPDWSRRMKEALRIIGL